MFNFVCRFYSFPSGHFRGRKTIDESDRSLPCRFGWVIDGPFVRRKPKAYVEGQIFSAAPGAVVSVKIANVQLVPARQIVSRESVNLK